LALGNSRRTMDCDLSHTKPLPKYRGFHSLPGSHPRQVHRMSNNVLCQQSGLLLGLQLGFATPYPTLSTLGKPHAAQYTGRSCCPLPVGFADSRLIRRTESTLTLLELLKRPPHEEGAELYLSPLGGGPRILTRLWIVQQRLNGVVENRQLGLLVDRPDPFLAMDAVVRSLVTVPT